MTKKTEVIAQDRGRPSKFSQILADEIVDRLSDGEPLAHICRDDHMPHRDTVRNWALNNEAFSKRIARAREDGFDEIAQDALDIADDGSRDYTKAADGRDVPDHDHIQRSKLRVETRLKLLAKWDPRRYGDRVQTDVQALGADGNPTDPAAINVMYAAMANLSVPDLKALIALYRRMGVRLPHESPTEAGADE